jgi:hypothetical protein
MNIALIYHSASPSSASSTSPPNATVSPIPVPKKKSKAWIAGAAVGGVAGLALIGAAVFFCLRRNKTTAAQPQHGAAVSAPAGQPPVTQYADTKPAFSPHQSSFGQPSPGYNPNDPYNQQYGQQPLSPAPQYSAPYSAPGSPPPPEAGHHPLDQKQVFQQVNQNYPQAAELGGISSPVSGSHTAELSGEHVQR